MKVLHKDGEPVSFKLGGNGILLMGQDITGRECPSPLTAFLRNGSKAVAALASPAGIAGRSKKSNRRTVDPASTPRIEK